MDQLTGKVRLRAAPQAGHTVMQVQVNVDCGIAWRDIKVEDYGILAVHPLRSDHETWEQLRDAALTLSK